MRCLNRSVSVRFRIEYFVERTSKLRSSSTQQGNKAGGVDDAASGVKALGRVRGVVTHREDGVLTTPPDTLEVDVHGKVPDTLLGVESVVIFGMHNACTWGVRVRGPIGCHKIAYLHC